MEYPIEFNAFIFTLCCTVYMIWTTSKCLSQIQAQCDRIRSDATMVLPGHHRMSNKHNRSLVWLYPKCITTRREQIMHYNTKNVSCEMMPFTKIERRRCCPCHHPTPHSSSLYIMYTYTTTRTHAHTHATHIHISNSFPSRFTAPPVNRPSRQYLLNSIQFMRQQ